MSVPSRSRGAVLWAAIGVAAAPVILLTFGLFLAGATRVAAQDQPAMQSPPYDPAQVTVPLAPPTALAAVSNYQENCAACHGPQGMGDGEKAAQLPSPPTAFADPAAIWQTTPAQMFHTTKFGRLEKLMPPWERLGDDLIWNSVAYAWSLHTTEAEIKAGAELYTASCASCHGDQGKGDGPEAEGALPDFSDQQYIIFRSQADLTAGWQKAHPEVGGEWSSNDQANTLEYIRTFSYRPPWVSPYQAGTGVITGTVVQGSAGGPAPTGGTVNLEAYLDFDPVAVFTGTVAADGTFTFTDLSTDPSITYLATVAANGISYSGGLVNLSPITQTLGTTVAVFETTDDPSGIRINRGHWIVDQQPGAILGGAIYILGNTGDRTFVGQQVEGVDVPVTAAIMVPPGATQVALDNGEIGDRYRQVGDVIYDTLPIVPGSSTRQIVVRYAYPFDGTSADLSQQFLYPADQLTLLVADVPGTTVDAPALEFAGPQDMGGQAYQIYRANDLPPATVDVKLSGLLAAGTADPRAGADTSGSTGDTGAGGTAAQATQTLPPLESWVTWAMLGLVGAGLVGVLGLALQRGSVATRQSRDDLVELRELLIKRIAHLDDLHAMGDLSQSDWLGQRSQLKAQLVDVLHQLEQGAH